MKRLVLAVVVGLVAGVALAAGPTRYLSGIQSFVDRAVFQTGLETASSYNTGIASTVDAGTGTSTVTVASVGAHCVCSGSSAVVAARCTVASGTLTIRTAADAAIAYICL